MTMSEVHPTGTQLDRIERGVNQLNERMARLEERQNNQGASIESHGERIQEHAVRLSAIEVKQAVIDQAAESTSKRLFGRWAAAGSVVLVLLGAAASTVGKVLADLLNTGAQ